LPALLSCPPVLSVLPVLPFTLPFLPILFFFYLPGGAWTVIAQVLGVWNPDGYSTVRNIGSRKSESSKEYRHSRNKFRKEYWGYGTVRNIESSKSESSKRNTGTVRTGSVTHVSAVRITGTVRASTVKNADTVKSEYSKKY
jgi:hypothetical protein